MDDEVLNHAFSHGSQPDHTERLADDAELRSALHAYFAWATTTTMARYHDSAADVPYGLTIPRWGWQGLVGQTAPGE